ncbi:MAG TPA: sigma-70 family RNA polymerase sigma factor [Armatimonadota bacterium]|nr:sigma-70 family RNA polymerase sigma factor [Armatimonadota bacterium]
MVGSQERQAPGERERTDSYQVTPVNVARAVRSARAVTGQWVRRLPRWMDREAFIGEALLAVAVAADGYRADAGATFLHFAYRRVQYALVGEARRQDPVSKFRRAKLRRGEAEGEATDLPPLSLEALLQEEPESAAVLGVDPFPGPEREALAGDEAARVRAAVEALDGREQLVIRLRYWEDQTQTAIAPLLGVTSARVQQIERKALGKLRRRLAPDEGLL